MAMPAFDTHKAVKALCSAGFDDAQAEAVVEQIGDAFNENIATKTDIEGLATKEGLREAVAVLATKEELQEAVAMLATKEELQEAVAMLATKEEFRQEVGRLDTRLDRLDTKLDNAVEKFELRLVAELEKQTTKTLKSVVVVAAAFVGLSKALDLLVG